MRFFSGQVPAFTGALLSNGDFVRMFDHLGEQPALDAGDEGERDNDRHPFFILRVDEHGFLVIGNQDALKPEERTITTDRF
jgi:hypothetical protein